MTKDQKDKLIKLLADERNEYVVKTLEEREPCEDAISRQAAIEVVRKWFDKIQLNSDICLDGIISLPSVTPQPKWIPVSEKLPVESALPEDVLFCDIDGDIMIGYHVNGKPNTHFTQQGTYEDIKNVVAWMPLPQPYKGESEEVEHAEALRSPKESSSADA